MTRGRKGEKCPEFAEASSKRKTEYRCILCLSVHGAFAVGTGWIDKNSWSRHTKSKTHLEALAERERVSDLAKIMAELEAEQPEFIDQGDNAFQLPVVDEPKTKAQLKDMSVGENDMWTNLDSGQYKITLDNAREEHVQKLREFERRVQDFNLMAGVHNVPHELSDDTDLDGLLHEGDGEGYLEELLNRVGISHQEVLTKLCQDGGLSVDEDWEPYPSKLVFLLDAIDNMPRLRISAGLMRVILWLLNEAGVKCVPAFSQLRDFQSSLRQLKGVETIDCVSPMGNTFSFNNPVDIIANDWNNPKVRPHIRRYPVLSKDGVISEIWHGEKWRKTIDRHAMSPMYDDERGRHYFIDEPARLLEGSLVIPTRWFEDIDDIVWFEGWRVRYEDNGHATIVDSDDQLILLKASDLKENFLDLQDGNAIPVWSNATVVAGHPSRMPNPDRQLAEGDPIYTSLIDIFGDDVSGNRSKSWNKHWNVYIKHRNLPRALLQKDVHTRFVSTSPHASVTEQFQGIKQIIEETHTKPAKVYDCQKSQQVRLKLQCNCEPGDNPAQSEVSGHIGGGGNHPCRRCNVGGTKKNRQEDDGFHQLFEPGTPRSVDETFTMVKQQVQTACRGIASHVEALQKESGVKDAYTQHWIEKLIGWSRERQTAGGRSPADVEAELKAFVQEHTYAIYNPFLTLKYSDVTQDTPVEILHTILLGVVKYSWYWTHSTWKESQKEIYAPRLQGTNTLGLSVPAIRSAYITQYANSLIGRQLKILVQTNAFHVHDLVGESQYELIKATGALSALLWFPEINNLQEYLVDLKIVIANVLDCAAATDPSKIVAKIKFHLLTHIPDDVTRIGPIIGGSTESYESFNVIFRHCSILSNHQAPSRDIAHQLAKQETFRHFICGGWWMGSEGVDTNQWKQSGSALRKYASNSEVLKHLFDFSSPQESAPLPGYTVLAAMPRPSPEERPCPRVELAFNNTEARGAIPVDIERMQQPGRQWYRGKSVVASSGDVCREQSWVFSRGLEVVGGQSGVRNIFTGRVSQILKAVDEDYTIVVIERFEVSQDMHPRFEMPVLCKPFGEISKIVVAATDILFDYNVQHDCYTGACAPTGKKAIKQERVDSKCFEKVIEHSKVDRFVINTHAFHNAHRLRSVTTAMHDLLRPRLKYPDRKQHHSSAASGLRDSQSKGPPGEQLQTGASTQKPSKKRKWGPAGSGGASEMPTGADGEL